MVKYIPRWGHWIVDSSQLLLIASCLNIRRYWVISQLMLNQKFWPWKLNWIEWKMNWNFWMRRSVFFERLNKCLCIFPVLKCTLSSLSGRNNRPFCPYVTWEQNYRWDQADPKFVFSGRFTLINREEWITNFHLSIQLYTPFCL